MRHPVLPLLFPLLAALFLAPRPASADPPPPAPPVDQAKIDEAVEKGRAWLSGKLKGGLPAVENDQKEQAYDEMVLYTLLHAGAPRNDPDIVKLVQKIQAKPLDRTYTTALRAMAFQLYDPELTKADLMNCAMFLVDNQCRNGQWSYGKPVQLPKVSFTPDTRKYTVSGPGGGNAAAGGAAPAPARATVAKTKKRLARRAWSDETGDNSNTQYAMLGLKACMAAGIYPPEDCLKLNEKWYTGNQDYSDGGWNYGFLGVKSYGSMTVGGVSSLSICVAETGKAKPAEDRRIIRGIEWLAAHLEFDKNPEGKGYYEQWVYYYIYGLERAGSLAQTENFNGRLWYNEGAAWLIGKQRGDGTWVGPVDREQRVLLDTCWAILFLKRATRHLVYTK